MKTKKDKIKQDRIKNKIIEALLYKGLNKTDLARLLAKNEIKEWKCEASDDEYIKTVDKYKNLITRWTNGYATPNQSNIVAISEALNISTEYFLGKLQFPLQKYISEDQQQEIELFQKRGFLLKYIEEYLMYNIDNELVFDKDGKPVEPLFFQIEREVNAFLSARLDNLGVSKKEGKDYGNNTQEE